MLPRWINGHRTILKRPRPLAPSATSSGLLTGYEVVAVPRWVSLIFSNGGTTARLYLMHQHDIMATRGQPRPREYQNSVTALQIARRQTALSDEVN